MAGRLSGDERELLQAIEIHARALAEGDVSNGRLNTNERNLLAEIEYWLRGVAAGGGVNPASLISADADNALTQGGDLKLFVPEGGGGVGYLVYTALVTQQGTDAPVPLILENTLGGVSVWTRLDAGSYLLTLAGAFTENKTFLLPRGSVISVATDDLVSVCSLLWNNVNSIVVVTTDSTGDQADDVIGAEPMALEIRVYP